MSDEAKARELLRHLDHYDESVIEGKDQSWAADDIGQVAAALAAEREAGRRKGREEAAKVVDEGADGEDSLRSNAAAHNDKRNAEAFGRTARLLRLAAVEIRALPYIKIRVDPSIPPDQFRLIGPPEPSGGGRPPDPLPAAAALARWTYDNGYDTFTWRGTFETPDGPERREIICRMERPSGGGQPDEARARRLAEYSGPMDVTIRHLAVDLLAALADRDAAAREIRRQDNRATAAEQRAEAAEAAVMADARLNVELQDKAVALKQRAEAAERDRDHWREARRAAMEAGELLKQRAEAAERERDLARRELFSVNGAQYSVGEAEKFVRRAAAAEARVAEQAREVEGLRDVLSKAAMQFRHYEVIHREKFNSDKADANAKWATLCERAALEAGR